MLTKHTLQSIQSGTDQEVYLNVTNAALYMATGGYLEQANQLLSGLWKYRRPHDRLTWLPDTAFMVLWHAAGKYPDYIPFSPDNIDSIEKNMRGYIAIDKWAYKMPDKPWQELTGQDLLRKAFITAALTQGNGVVRMDLHSIMNPAPGSEQTNLSKILDKIGQYAKSVSVEASDSFPSSQDELEALAMLDKLIDGNAVFPDGLALAAELAARNGKPDSAVQFAKIWAEGYHTNSPGYNFPLLACSRHVAPLLLQKVVAGELQLSETVVQEYLSQVLVVLDKRMTQGRSLAYGDLGWKELLKKISFASIELKDEGYDEAARNSGWIGLEGADRDDITIAEKRLGIILPEDYKAFLGVTNGFRSFPLNNPELLPVTEIDYLRNVLDSTTFNIIASSPIEDVEPQTYKTLLSNAILISSYPDEQMVWLMPENIEMDRWQTWFYAPWMPGETKYPGFRYYMEDQLQSAEDYLIRNWNDLDKSRKIE